MKAPKIRVTGHLRNVMRWFQCEKCSAKFEALALRSLRVGDLADESCRSCNADAARAVNPPSYGTKNFCPTMEEGSVALDLALEKRAYDHSLKNDLVEHYESRGRRVPQRFFDKRPR